MGADAVLLAVEDGAQQQRALEVLEAALGFEQVLVAERDVVGAERVVGGGDQVLAVEALLVADLGAVEVAEAASLRVIGLAAIVGAFLAGMMVAETRDLQPVEREIAPLYALFPSFFFVFIGASIDLDALAGPDTLALLAALTAISFAAKFLACWFAARPLGRRDALIVGFGMTPRGEVGIVVAGLGASVGALDAELFAVLVGASVLTSLLAPPAIRHVTRRPASP